MEKRYIQSFFFLILLVGTLAVVVAMILPFANILILAAVLAFLFAAPYERLARRIGNRSVAAWIMVLGVLVTVVLPLTLAAYRIVQEAGALYGYLRGHASPQALQQLVDVAQQWLDRFVPGTTLDAQQISASIQTGLGWLLAHSGWLFAGIVGIAVGFLFLLLFFFYILRDGRHLKRRIMDLSPMTDEQEERIFGKVGRAISATIRGKLVLSIIQGLVAGLGLALFGVPNAALLGALTVLASFLPTVGTGLVLVPASIYLFITGHTGAAVGMLLWAVAVVGLLDNVLGPKLMSKGTSVHPLVMLLAVLGGISLFGPMGLLLGPILVALLYALLDIYLSLVRPGSSSSR